MFLADDLDESEGSDAGCSCCDIDEDNDNLFENKPSPLDSELYCGSSITIREFVLSMGLLKSDIDLPDSHLCKILKFICMILPKTNNCPSTVYKFKQYLSQDNEIPLNKNFFCSNCIFSEDNTINDVNNDRSVDNEEIVEDPSLYDCNEKKDYFIDMPLIPQLELLYRRTGFYEKLKYKDTLVNNAGLQDIYHGSIFKELTQGILSSKDNISFMWYTDGVRIFKSSKLNVWGFFLIILELPYEERFKLENVLLVSLWFGDKKPVPNLFLQPLKKSLKKLYKGINLYVTDLDREIIVKGIVLCGTADLPAKALFLSMNQYNGRFGCQVCLQEGNTVDRTRTYSYQENILLRTEENVLECSMQALDIRQPVCGVKGPSVISKICPKFITSTAVDVMHCVFEGVTKKLIELWCSSKLANENYNISNFIDIIDDKLCSIKPPSFIHRRPRPIQSHFEYWKASELKYWFFYYSIPVLTNILPEIYLNHYKMLVLGVYILCKEEITIELLERAKSLIDEFLRRFESLYGIKNMTCNTHSLGHLADVVRRLGPLWTTSCFSLEDLNGQMKKLVHGSKKPELQIVSNLNLYIKIHALKYEWLREDSDVYNFCKTLSSPEKKLKLTKIGNGVHLCGSAIQIKGLDAEKIIKENNLPGNNLFLFKKLYKNKTLYTSKSAQKDQKTESYYVTYLDDRNVKIGVIENYIRATNCNCKKLCDCFGYSYACLRKIHTANPFFVRMPEITLQYIHKCIYVDNEITFIDVSNIKNVCIHIEFENDKNYVCEPVNTLEIE